MKAKTGKEDRRSYRPRSWPAVDELFARQAVTISKVHDEVHIGCENGKDAESIFEWLSQYYDELIE